MMLLSFVALGSVFAFVYSLVTFVENAFLPKVLSFILDVLMMLSFAVAFFCFVIGFGADGFRYYHLLLTLIGFVLYRQTVHRLFIKTNRRLANKVSAKRRKSTNRLKKF